MVLRVSPRGWKAARKFEQQRSSALTRADRIASRHESHQIDRDTAGLSDAAQGSCQPSQSLSSSMVQCPAALCWCQNIQQLLVLLAAIAALFFAAGWMTAKRRSTRTILSACSTPVDLQSMATTADKSSGAVGKAISCGSLSKREDTHAESDLVVLRQRKALGASSPTSSVHSSSGNMFCRSRPVFASAIPADIVEAARALPVGASSKDLDAQNEHLSSASSSVASACELMPPSQSQPLQPLGELQTISTADLRPELRPDQSEAAIRSPCPTTPQVAGDNRSIRQARIPAEHDVAAVNRGRQLRPPQQPVNASNQFAADSRVQHVQPASEPVSAGSEQSSTLHAHPIRFPLLPPLHPAENEAAWRDAVQLMSTLATQADVSIADLSAGDRVQLIGVAVSAWQTLQQRDAHQVAALQGKEANSLRSTHNHLVFTGLTDKQARHQAAEAVRGKSALQATLTDCIMTGLALTVISLLYCGMRYGLLHVRIASCPSAMPLAAISMFRPWEALAPLRAATCWLFVIGDVLLGVIMVLGTAYVALKTRVMTGHHALPLYRLVLGLGLLCGGAGFVSVGKIGGNRSTWLLMWWTWITVLVALVMNLTAVYSMLRGPLDSGTSEDLQRRLSADPNSGTSRGSSSSSSSSRTATSGKRRGLIVFAIAACKALTVFILAVWWPLSMGCVPFERSVVGELLKLLKQPTAAALRRIFY